MCHPDPDPIGIGPPRFIPMFSEDNQIIFDYDKKKLKNLKQGNCIPIPELDPKKIGRPNRDSGGSTRMPTPDVD